MAISKSRRKFEARRWSQKLNQARCCAATKLKYANRSPLLHSPRRQVRIDIMPVEELPTCSMQPSRQPLCGVVKGGVGSSGRRCGALISARQPRCHPGARPSVFKTRQRSKSRASFSSRISTDPTQLFRPLPLR